MVNITEVQSKFEARKIYTYREVLNIINPHQSSVANYIMQDLLASGMLEHTVNGYRIKQ